MKSISKIQEVWKHPFVTLLFPIPKNHCYLRYNSLWISKRSWTWRSESLERVNVFCLESTWLIFNSMTTVYLQNGSIPWLQCSHWCYLSQVHLKEETWLRRWTQWPSVFTQVSWKASVIIHVPIIVVCLIISLFVFYLCISNFM